VAVFGMVGTCGFEAFALIPFANRLPIEEAQSSAREVVRLR
jgi:hypothetical protein